MKTMKIYEPAMCCPTGLCGVGVDPELLRISTVLNTLKQNDIEVQRFNLTSAPAEFVKSKAVTEYLQKFGPEKLPVVTVEDIIVITGRYPTNAEFTSWLDLSGDVLGVQCCEAESSCCCGSESEPEEEGCCCGDTPATDGCCTPDCCSDGVIPEGCCTDSSEGCCAPDCCTDAPAPEGCCTDTPASEGCCSGSCC